MLLFLFVFTSRFLSDLEEGVFVQQTLEIVLFNEDGKQLLVCGLCVLSSYSNTSKKGALGQSSGCGGIETSPH